jgi:2-amino-4-hydroxy-6-hydroxymethyldihydropteridine diphosphokinase
MARVYVSIGSNIDREKNIETAVRELNDSYGPLMLSTVYESEPVGFDGNDFLNLVAGFDTDSPIETVITRLRAIEKACGRERQNNNDDSRTLDIDLLVYGDLSRHDDEIDIPREEIGHHAFVLLPLAEIAPEHRHPETGIPFGKMWSSFRGGEQQLWPANFELPLM